MKEKVAFVCVHNSCRSQIAEVLGKSLVSEILKAIQQVRRRNHRSIKMLSV